jgi:1-acyl-sn-glycerol-3-phosphate acyltransferase
MIITPLILFFHILYQFITGCKIDTWKYTAKLFFFVTRTKIKFTENSQQLIPHGFILCNHRSWTDFAFDPLHAKSSFITRRLALIGCLFAAVLGLFEKRVIWFVRPKKNSKEKISHKIFEMCLQHLKKNGKYCDRIMFYPEGTRKKYTSLASPEELKTKHLKYGLLKRIYQYQELPVQLMITMNKELVVNEKKLSCNFNVELRSKITESISPQNYQTFDEFIDKIAEVWFQAYQETHSIKKEN